MTTATETEKRAPEQCAEHKPQGNGDPPVPAGSDKPQSLDALKRLSTLYPKEVGEILAGNDADTRSSEIYSKLNQAMDHHGWGCIADVAEFIENWKPENNGPAIARIIALLQKCSPEFLRGLAAEIAYQNKQNKDEDEDEWRSAQFATGTRMKAEHLFRGWATVIRNVTPMLHAITCFTDEDGRQTKYDDQDGLGIDQMVGFARKELKVLAQDCDRAGDCSNPRFVTPGGYVWKLETEAVLISKPADEEGGAN